MLEGLIKLDYIANRGTVSNIYIGRSKGEESTQFYISNGRYSK